MKRLYVVVEGETERQLISKMIAPHMRGLGIGTLPIVVETSGDTICRKKKGGGDWTKRRKDYKSVAVMADVRLSAITGSSSLGKRFPLLWAAVNHAVFCIRKNW